MGRRGFDKNQRETTLANQDYKCKLCGDQFKKNRLPHYDHKNGDSSDNNTKNCQAICANCHDAKSRKENVKRSIDKKNIDFVRFCPLCQKKIHGKNFANDKTKEQITTKHLAADDFFPCPDCESVLKIVRYDPKAGAFNLRGKKINGVVKYCPHCGVEFDDAWNSNHGLKCDKCKKGWGVWIKEYKKKSGWW